MFYGSAEQMETSFFFGVFGERKVEGYSRLLKQLEFAMSLKGGAG